MLDKQYTLLSAKVRFIQDIIDQKISIMNKKIKEVDAQLAEMKYPAMTDSAVDEAMNQEPTEDTSEQSDNSEEIQGEELKIKEVPSYNYLTRMPIHQLTYEKKRSLEKEAEGIKMKIEDLKAKPLQKIWYDELQEFKAAWIDHKTTVEEEYRTDRLMRPQPTKTKKR
jgi:hypothetical protein